MKNWLIFYAAYNFSPLYHAVPKLRIVSLEMNGFARQNPRQSKSRHGQSKAQGSLSFQDPFPSSLQPD